MAPSQIYDWRKKFVEAAAPAGGDGFVAVIVSPDGPVGSWAGRMEVRCRNGRTITMGCDVDVAVLAKLVAMLDQ